MRAYDLREIWIGDVRLTGQGTLAANVAIADPYIDIDGDLLLDDMRAEIGDAPVAQAIHGSAPSGASGWVRQCDPECARSRRAR